MTRRYWTAEEDAVLRARFPHETTKSLAHDMRCAETRISARAAKLGLKKSAEHLAHCAGRLAKGDGRGGATRFKAGTVPWNKGTHFTAGGRSAETRFKPGRTPQTWVPVGTEVVDTDGYRKRKVRDDAPKGQARFNWVFVHRALWEQHHGVIPRGYSVVFKNGDKADIRIENLELVTREELMRRNTVHNLPKEVAQLVQLKGAVMRQVNKRRRATSG